MPTLLVHVRGALHIALSVIGVDRTRTKWDALVAVVSVGEMGGGWAEDSSRQHLIEIHCRARLAGAE